MKRYQTFFRYRVADNVKKIVPVLFGLELRRQRRLRGEEPLEVQRELVAVALPLLQLHHAHGKHVPTAAHPFGPSRGRHEFANIARSTRMVNFR